MADATINIAIKTDPAQPLQLLIKQSKEAEKAVDGLSGSFGKVAGALGGLAALKGTFDFILDSTRQMQDLTTQFIAFTGSADGATQQMQKLADFASTSPFELAEVAEANRTLLAFGSSTEQSLEQLRQLGEVSAAVGKPIGELATIFGQIQAEGKLTGERFNQLIERGVNIGPELAKSLGVASTSIRGLISDSAISSEEVAKAFQKMTSEGGQFFGATERLSKTVSGQLSTLKDAVSLLAAEVGKNAVPAFAEYTDGLTRVIDSVREFVAERNKIASETGDAKRIRELGSQIDELGAKIQNLKDPGIGTKVLEGIGAINTDALLRKFSTEFKKLVDERNALIDKANAELAEKQKQIAKAESDQAAGKSAQEKLQKEQEAAKLAQEARDKAAAEETKKVEEKEKRITEIAFQEAAVRNAILKEQEGANDIEKIAALQEREAVLTSERLRIESERLLLLKEFENAELLQRQDTLNKKVAAEQKAENERLKVIKKSKDQQFDFERVAAEQQKKFDEATALEKLKMTANVLNDISALSRNKNRELAAIGKAAALFQIGIGIPDAAQRAYTSASIFGPVAGAAAAALAVAAGVQRLEEVRSQQLGFAEGGVVPGVGNKDTVPALLTPGEVVVPKKNFADLESSFIQGAVANDQVILLRQSNDIQARILESVTFGPVIEKLTTIIAKLDSISVAQSSRDSSFDTTSSIDTAITEIAQNQPQGGRTPVLQIQSRNRESVANR